jgi:FHA domain
MLKCPFCAFDNEEGALFCEQCKSDLSGVPSTPAGAAAPVAMAVEETIPMAAAVEDVVPVAAAEATVPIAEAVPLAEAAPIAAAAVAEPPPAAAPPPPPAAAPAAPTTAPEALPAGAQPKLVVIRGQKLNVEYPLYEGHNFIGRSDEKPVDVDLDDQEPPDRVWTSRQHALVTFENNTLAIEDLNSANGTFVNRNRVYPGSKCPLKVGDIVQIGTVQMKVKA